MHVIMHRWMLERVILMLSMCSWNDCCKYLEEILKQGDEVNANFLMFLILCVKKCICFMKMNQIQWNIFIYTLYQ
jgi:hypothetical protein